MQFSGRLVLIIALAITVLLVSNIIASKPLELFQLPFAFMGSMSVVASVSIICFPLGYIISDVLTEVYGFRVARGVIWLGFLCNLVMVAIFFIAISIPAPGFWTHRGLPTPSDAPHAYRAILGSAGWLLVGSFAAYLVGEFANAMVMVVLKNRTRGRMLWLRTISSTIVGQGIDSILFYAIAFGVSGLWGWQAALGGAVTAWIIKTLYEVAATPLTYLVVGWLKRTERMDVYDAPHSLNPLGIFGGDASNSRNAAVESA